MPVIARDLGSVYLTFSYGASDDDILGHKASYEDWDNWPEDAPTNIVYAGGGDDFVITGFGNDIAFGGGGNDVLIGHGTGGPTPSAGLAIADRDEHDYLDGGSGNDVLYAGGGVDILIGGDGDDELHGDGEEDVLFAGAGNDVLIGGGEADRLYGGEGADIFVTALAANTPDASYPGEAPDIVMDFQPGTDKLDLSGYGVAAGGATVTQTDDGVTVSFDFYDNIISVELRGISALQQGDILYYG